jgi:hypothetical protein
MITREDIIERDKINRKKSEENFSKVRNNLVISLTAYLNDFIYSSYKKETLYITDMDTVFGYSGISETQALIVLEAAIKNLREEWIFSIGIVCGAGMEGVDLDRNYGLYASVINIEDTIWYKIKRMIGIK